MYEKNYTLRGTRWKSKSRYVDIDTGEELTKRNAETNYIYIASDKHTELNRNETFGFITWTKKFCKNPQTKLF